MRLDALIFGGGAAGLWLLDRLSRDGHHVLLLEANSLGSGETVASQGILHIGLKYSVTGLLTKSGKNVREMSHIWRDSLLGRSEPNLSKTRLRSGCCYLWQADANSPRAGIAGTRPGLQIRPESISNGERPEALSGVRGTVSQTPQQVIAPRSFVQDLASQYGDRILQIDAKNGLEFELDSPGDVSAVTLASPTDRALLKLNPRQVIFTAGGGNARLRSFAGLSADVMERRPLQMVLVRGNLPELNGYCVDGSKTRLTITSEIGTNGLMVWQIGGQIAEDGAVLNGLPLIQRAKSELNSVLPGIDLRDAEWSTYSVDRAEGATTKGGQTESVQVLCAGNVTTGWHTKLVLAPVLAQEIASRASSPYFSSEFDTTPFAHWPRPEVALHPWDESDRQWQRLIDGAMNPQRRVA